MFEIGKYYRPKSFSRVFKALAMVTNSDTTDNPSFLCENLGNQFWPQYGYWFILSNSLGTDIFYEEVKYEKGEWVRVWANSELLLQDQENSTTIIF